MSKKSMKIMKNLSHSILLKESGSPVLVRSILLFFVFIVTFFVIWSSFIELNQVVITTGEILPKDDVAVIQHPQGGIISNIHVKEGDLVEIGDTLLSLDGIQISTKIKEEISEIGTLNRNIEFLKEELNIKKELLDQELISKITYLTLERNYNNSLGNRTQAYYRLEGFRYLKENLLIISTIKGYVHSSQNISIGTIIKPGETIFEIIPFSRQYIAELKLQAKDRGKVAIGQKVTLKVTSYSYAKYGGLESKLQSISVKTFTDNYNRPYYKAFVEIPKNYIGNDERKFYIMTGMTLSGEISIGSKSLLEYLIVPVRAATNNSFNEP